MTDSLPQAVLEAADVSAVTQLILRERVSRDLGLWEQMRDCFHDDSVVRISWINASGPEFVRRSKEMAERNVQASHRLGPIFVTLAGDRAIAQLVVIIDIPFKLDMYACARHGVLYFDTEMSACAQTWNCSVTTIVRCPELAAHALKEPVVNGIGVGRCSSAACRTEGSL